MSRRRQQLQRAGSIVGLAARIAGRAALSLGDRLSSGRDEALEHLHEAAAAQLLETFSRMRGLPMKLGQILSFMDGVIPAEYAPIYRRTLTVLQTKVQPQSWDLMQQTFREEFGCQPEDVFASFDPNPIAAASIGQVYRASLHDGRSAAVKIQYPGIAEAVAADLKSVETILKTFRLALPGFDNEQLSRDFLDRFDEELDYQKEAAHQKAFYKVWASDSAIIIPEPIAAHTRKRVLVSAWHSGKSLATVLTSSNQNERSAFGETLFRFTYQSILRFGLFNADPHPGNYLFQDNGRIVFLDFGAVQTYDQEARKAFNVLLQALLDGRRGEDLWTLLESTLLMAPGTSAPMKTLFMDYMLYVLQPILAPQPFRFSVAFTTEVSRLSKELKLTLAKNMFKLQWREPKRPGLAPLVRILFGLNSVLAALEAESNWCLLLQDDAAN